MVFYFTYCISFYNEAQFIKPFFAAEKYCIFLKVCYNIKVIKSEEHPYTVLNLCGISNWYITGAAVKKCKMSWRLWGHYTDCRRGYFDQGLLHEKSVLYQRVEFNLMT